MVQGVTSAVIPNIAYYSQVQAANMYLTSVMNEAMLLRSRLDSLPAMDTGTGKSVNTMG